MSEEKIVVIDEHGHSHAFAADDWDHDDHGYLHVTDDGEPVAVFAPGHTGVYRHSASREVPWPGSSRCPCGEAGVEA